MSEKILQPDREKYDLVSPMFHALYTEVKELSKKHSNDILNEYKIVRINRVLKMVLELVHDEPTAQFLELLENPEKDELDRTARLNYGSGLTYSDAVIVLSQFDVALNKYHSQNFLDAWEL